MLTEFREPMCCVLQWSSFSTFLCHEFPPANNTFRAGQKQEVERQRERHRERERERERDIVREAPWCHDVESDNKEE